MQGAGGKGPANPLRPILHCSVEEHSSKIWWRGKNKPLYFKYIYVYVMYTDKYLNSERKKSKFLYFFLYFLYFFTLPESSLEMH